MRKQSFLESQGVWGIPPGAHVVLTTDEHTMEAVDLVAASRETDPGEILLSTLVDGWIDPTRQLYIIVIDPMSPQGSSVAAVGRPVTFITRDGKNVAIIATQDHVDYFEGARPITVTLIAPSEAGN